jgi:hypothetical protein
MSKWVLVLGCFGLGMLLCVFPDTKTVGVWMALMPLSVQSGFFLAAITSEMVERFGPILTLGYCLLVTLAVAALGFVECWSLAPLW